MFKIKYLILTNDKIKERWTNTDPIELPMVPRKYDSVYVSKTKQYCTVLKVFVPDFNMEEKTIIQRKDGCHIPDPKHGDIFSVYVRPLEEGVEEHYFDPELLIL